MTKQQIETVETTLAQPQRVKKYDPYSKYASSSDIHTSLIVEDWNCEIVEPKDPALHTSANIDPFGKDIDWAAREKEMFDLMMARVGIGLAAPQVGSNYNMFVMAHSVLGNIGVYKPEIVEYSKDTVTNKEGCLTFPLLWLPVKRSKEIKVKYWKNDGETQVEVRMDGTDAIVFQHEYDHLQGELFIDKVSEFKLRRAFEKREKQFKRIGRVFGHD